MSDKEYKDPPFEDRSINEHKLIPEMEPNFMGGVAYCSCYITVENRSFGKCPQWRKKANGDYHFNFWCQIGGGTMGGSICVPFYRHLGAAMRTQSKLLEMMNAEINPEAR